MSFSRTTNFDGLLSLWGETLDWPVRVLDGLCYALVLSFLETFPELSASSISAPADGVSETWLREGWRTPEEEKAILRNLTLTVGEQSFSTRGFVWNGTLYAPVSEVAQLLGVSIEGE